jgi:hypothetical protein
MLRFVYNAAKQLQAQHPEQPALTLDAEIQDLRQRYGRVETNLPEEPEARLTVSDAVQEANQILGQEPPL